MSSARMNRMFGPCAIGNNNGLNGLSGFGDPLNSFNLPSVKSVQSAVQKGRLGGMYPRDIAGDTHPQRFVAPVSDARHARRSKSPIAAQRQDADGGERS